MDCHLDTLRGETLGEWMLHSAEFLPQCPEPSLRAPVECGAQIYPAQRMGSFSCQGAGSRNSHLLLHLALTCSAPSFQSRSCLVGSISALPSPGSLAWDTEKEHAAKHSAAVWMAFYRAVHKCKIKFISL